MNQALLGILCVLSTLVYVPRAMGRMSTWDDHRTHVQIMSVIQIVAATLIYVVWGTRLIHWLFS